MSKPHHIAKYLESTTEDLVEMLPAYVDTQKNLPFNGYCLQINKRSSPNIKYIVSYVCDTYKAEDLANPFHERILHKTCSERLPEALADMHHYLATNNLID